MSIQASEISELIKARIQNFTAAPEARSVGTVVSVTDGIVRIHGLQDAVQGEMLEFPKNTFGLALNLERGFRKNGDGEFVQVPEAVVGQRVFILAKKLLGERRAVVGLVSLGIPRVNRPGETGRAQLRRAT